MESELILTEENNKVRGNGKNFGNRKPVEQRPENDFYETPPALTELLVKTGVLEGVKTIWDPCCGRYAITKVLEKHGFTCFKNDVIYGDDYLTTPAQKHECIVMNPPFSLFNKFCRKAKNEADLVCAIGKLTFFGAHDRNVDGLWEHLKTVYVFDRQVAYDYPLREDNKLYIGMLVTGWFVWDMNYNGKPQIEMLDVNDFIYRKSDDHNKKGGKK